MTNSSREDWITTVRENRKKQQQWDDNIPAGFVDAPIKENLTGKAKKPATQEPAKGTSLDTI